jgi:hypothetical protein
VKRVSLGYWPVPSDDMENVVDVGAHDCLCDHAQHDCVRGA